MSTLKRLSTAGVVNFVKALPFFLPPLALYALFVLLPTLRVFEYSTFDWRGLSAEAQQFIGFSNFAELVQDARFWASVSRTLFVFVFASLVSIILGLLLAEILSEKIKGVSFYRATWLFPNMLGNVVIATIWTFIFHPNLGILNGALRALGLSGVTWLGNPDIAILSVSMPMIWRYGGLYIILFLAAIQEIPQQLFDAAAVDGASRVQRFFRITLPMLRQTIGVALIFVLNTCLNAMFAFVNLLTEGGPAGATEVLPVYVYRQAFTFNRYGYASAITVGTFVLMGVLAGVITKFFVSKSIV